MKVFSVFLLFILAFTTYPSYSAPSRLEILHLLKDGKYKALDKIIKTQQYEYERGAKNELDIMMTLNAFHSSNAGLEAQLDKWVANNPNSYPAYLARGSHYVHIAGLHRGAKYARETKKEQIANLRKYHAGAYEDFNTALSYRPKLMFAYGMLIRVATSSGTWDDINKLANDGLKIDPASYLIHRQMLFKLQPKWGGSKKALNRWLDEFVKPQLKVNPLLKALLGYPDFIVADVNRNKYKFAEKHYTKAVVASSGNYNAVFLRSRGRFYYFNDKYRLALADLNKALSHYPDYVEALYIRGRTYDDLKQYDNSLADLNLAISLDEFDPDIRRARSYLYKDLKKYGKALEDIDASLKYGSFDKYNWDAKGYLHRYFKDYKAAEAAFEKSIEIDPGNEKIWYELGAAQYNQIKCSFIPSLQEYLKLCKKDKCEKVYTDWSKSVINTAISGGHCKRP